MRTRRMSIVYVEDVAAAIVAALRAGNSVYGESINVSSAETPTFEEFVSALAAATQGSDKSCDNGLIFDHDKPALG